MARGLMPALSVEAADGDELLAAAIGQLDDGADLVKLYLDGPDLEASPWSVDELRRVVEAVHARGARVTAHSGYLAGSAGGRRGRRGRPRARVRARRRRRGGHGPQRRPPRVDARGDGLVGDVRDDDRRSRASRARRGERRTAARHERAVASVAIAHRGRRLDRDGDGLRRRLDAGEPAGLGGRAAGRGRPLALGGAGLRDLARAASCSAEPDAGTIREGGPADFALSTATPCPTRPPCGGCGTSRG